MGLETLSATDWPCRGSIGVMAPKPEMKEVPRGFAPSTVSIDIAIQSSCSLVLNIYLHNQVNTIEQVGGQKYAKGEEFRKIE